MSLLEGVEYNPPGLQIVLEFVVFKQAMDI